MVRGLEDVVVGLRPRRASGVVPMSNRRRGKNGLSMLRHPEVRRTKIQGQRLSLEAPSLLGGLTSAAQQRLLGTAVFSKRRETKDDKSFRGAS